MRIIKVGDPDDAVLFAKAAPVSAVDSRVKRLMNGLLDTMRKQRDVRGRQRAVGLSAPQVGIGLRVIAVGGTAGAPFALANPEIVWRSKTNRVSTEGCLSLPGKEVRVVRAVEVEVVGLDKRGKEFRIKAKDELAGALQHEVDHLNGVLITRRKFVPKEVPSDARGVDTEQPEAVASQ